MRTGFVTPVALLVALLWVAGSRDDASPMVLPGAAVTPACRSELFLGLDGARRYDDVIWRHARKRRLNPRLVKAIIATESRFCPRARSYCGARGLMQVMPATAKEFGVKASSLSDPETNISVGTEYLALLFKRAHGPGGRDGAPSPREVRRVLAAYHSGPSVMNASVWSGPTRRYVSAVLSCYGATPSELLPPRKAAAKAVKTAKRMKTAKVASRHRKRRGSA